MNLLLALTVGCGPGALAPVVIASQNAGTTPFMEILNSSDLRSTCEDYYDNNLCLLDSEQALAQTLAEAQPTLVFLQEMWHQPGCDDVDRPSEVQTAPFVCAGEGKQPPRVLPEGMAWSCSPGYPDNCIGWNPARFVPELDCAGLDCGENLEDLQTGCADPGRIAVLPGELDGEPTTLAVMHTTAGFNSDNIDCRVEQIEGLAARLSDADGQRLVVAGDVNLDPAGESTDDVEALLDLFEQIGLVRLVDDGDTSRLLEQDFDVVAVRDLHQELACGVSFVDEGLSPLMFDHGLLMCR